MAFATASRFKCPQEQLGADRARCRVGVLRDFIFLFSPRCCRFHRTSVHSTSLVARGLLFNARYTRVVQDDGIIPHHPPLLYIKEREDLTKTAFEEIHKDTTMSIN